MTPHNEAKKEDIANIVIMPGDPLRAKYITENFLEGQIKDAMEAKQKNERLYTRLGTIVGLAIVIVLC